MSEKSQPGPRNSSNSLGLSAYKFGINVTVLYNLRMDSNEHNDFNILLCDIKEFSNTLVIYTTFQPDLNKTIRARLTCNTVHYQKPKDYLSSLPPTYLR